jgi:hypothetical protein
LSSPLLSWYLLALALVCVSVVAHNEQERLATDECVTLQGRVSIWKDDAFFVTPCWSLDSGNTVNVSAVVSNPEGDETYSVASWVSPVEQYFPEHHCEVEYSSCALPYDWVSCVYTGNNGPIRSDFVVTTCGSQNNPVVQLACLKTPGFFNGKCDLQYSVKFCGNANSTSNAEQTLKCMANWQ